MSIEKYLAHIIGSHGNSYRHTFYHTQSTRMKTLFRGAQEDEKSIIIKIKSCNQLVAGFYFIFRLCICFVSLHSQRQLPAGESVASQAFS